MKSIQKAAIAATAAALMMSATPATAQQSGLVNVNITNIRDLIDVNVDISNIAVIAQVPIGIAANVCNVAVNVLAANTRQGDAQCTAENTSTAFNRLVQRRATGG